MGDIVGDTDRLLFNDSVVGWTASGRGPNRNTVGRTHPSGPVTDWRDAIAAERMELDGEFADRVAEAGLTNRQWGLVMSAVELRIESPESPATAELVADTSALRSVVDDLVAMDDGGPLGVETDEGGGFLDWLGSLRTDESREMRATAASLAEEYADRLEERLRESGRWSRICERADG